MTDLAYVDDLIQVLEFESLASSVAVEVDTPGPVVDFIRLPTNASEARRSAHERENRRLLDVLDAAAIFEERELSPMSLYALALEAGHAKIILRRRVAIALAQALPLECRVVEPTLVRMGRMAVVGQAMFVAPIADYLAGDVFPASVAYVVPPGSVEIWRRATGTALKFSIEANKQIRRVEEVRP